MSRIPYISALHILCYHALSQQKILLYSVYLGQTLHGKQDFIFIYVCNEPSDCLQTFGDCRDNREKLAKRVSHGFTGIC